MELIHSPDSEPGLHSQRQGKQPQVKRSRDFSNQKTKENNKKLLLLQTCLPHLKKEGAIGAFYCSNLVKGTGRLNRVKKDPVSCSSVKSEVM